MDPLYLSGCRIGVPPSWRRLFAMPWLIWLAEEPDEVALAVGGGGAGCGDFSPFYRLGAGARPDGSQLAAEGLLAPATIRQYLLVLALPSLLVASAVQESVKLGVAVLALRLRGQRRGAAGLAAGAAAGAGFGGFEAFWVFNRFSGLAGPGRW